MTKVCTWTIVTVFALASAEVLAQGASFPTGPSKAEQTASSDTGKSKTFDFGSFKVVNRINRGGDQSSMIENIKVTLFGEGSSTKVILEFDAAVSARHDDMTAHMRFMNDGGALLFQINRGGRWDCTPNWAKEAQRRTYTVNGNYVSSISRVSVEVPGKVTVRGCNDDPSDTPAF